MSLVDNKKARLDYEVMETFDAGIELFGYEVKSFRAGRGSLKGARVVVRGGEAYLVGASVPAWQVANAPKSYDPERVRRLLLTKKEILEIANAEDTKGLTCIPLSMHVRNRKLKLSIAIARGKKKYDKRATLKERDEKRNIERTMKQR
jgi:SsrA-binding protein